MHFSVFHVQYASSSIRLSRDDLEAQMTDLNDLMTQVRIRPFMEGKRPAGFLVSNIKPGSLTPPTSS